MNNRGFAISVILYSMVILIVGIMFLLLGVVKNRYNTNDQLKQNIIDYINDNSN